ncbi:MAG TPA: hypothetical protein ENH82_12565, partial [bacterium]|nr:hypothetical protein [bacterium]
MNFFKIHLFSGITALFIIAFTGCGQDPASPEPQNLSTITIIVEDEAGNPLKGVQVRTYPSTIILVTNKEGVAVFENIHTQNYQIVVSRADIPIFYRDIILRTNQNLKLKFIVATEITINLVVQNIEGQPLTGSLVTTSPSTSIVITDENGQAVLENVPVKSYIFIVQ